MGYNEHYKKEENKMNLGEKYKQLFEGKVRSNDATLLNESSLGESTKSQKQLDILFKLSIGAHVKHGEDRLYKLSQAWEDWNVDNDDEYDDLVDPLFAAVELVQDAGEPGTNNVTKDKEYYSLLKEADKLLKQFNKDAEKAMKERTK